MWCEGYAYIHVLIPSSPVSGAMIESGPSAYHTTVGVMVTNLGNTKGPNGDFLRDKVLFVYAQAKVVLINGLGMRELMGRV